MAEFVTVSREYRRLCDAFDICRECPLNDLVKNTPNCETGVFRGYPKDAERIIMQWAAEHPIKTNGKKFREVFGQPYEYLFEANGFIKQWLSQEYKGGQDEAEQ